MNAEHAEILRATLAGIMDEPVRTRTHDYLPEEAVVVGDSEETRHLLITTSDDDEREFYVGLYEPAEGENDGVSPGFVVTCRVGEIPVVARALWGGAFV